MPFFSRGESKNKLAILYVLKCAGMDLTHIQLYRIVFELDLMSYFDFENTVFELEEQGSVAAVPRSYGQVYRISASGETMLDSLDETIPESLREKIESYISEHRDGILSETMYPTAVEQLSNGSYRIRLSVLDGSESVLNIEMISPNQEMARKMRENWADASTEVYKSIVNNLLKD